MVLLSSFNMFWLRFSSTNSYLEAESCQTNVAEISTKTIYLPFGVERDSVLFHIQYNYETLINLEWKNQYASDDMIKILPFVL